MADSDDEIIQTSSVGERLKAAREKKKLSLEDIADQTRIPLRHLQNLEAGDWSNLPAPTYTIGFAKSYASAVDLDRTEIGEDLRAEMGGQRFETGSPEVRANTIIGMLGGMSSARTDKQATSAVA